MSTWLKNPKEMTAKDAADQIGCSRDTVERLIHAGEVKAYRITEAGFYHVDRKSVSDFIKKMHARNGKPAARNVQNVQKRVGKARRRR